MKKFTLFSVFLFVSILAMAEIADIPFVPEEFDVDILQYPHMLLIENPDSEQLDTYYTFTDKSSSYQVRYAFFKQTVPDRKDIRMVYAMCILPVIFNVAGYETDQMANFNDSDVKNEFNGDFGSTVFIMDPESDFGSGYKYIMMDFFYKKNQGIVVRSILFNDLNFLQNRYFMEIYHSFKFHE